MKKPVALLAFLAYALSIAACSGAAEESEAASGASALTVPVPPGEPGLDPVQAPDGGAFACGTISCDATTQYCKQIFGGPRMMGGASGRYTCVPAPSTCTSGVTCARIRGPISGPGSMPLGGFGPGRCTEANGDVTVTILAP